MKEIIKKTVSGKNLTMEEAYKAMELISNGNATPAQIAALLTAMAIKGETVEELTGFAKVMREKVTKIPVKNIDVIDTCGTGGDHSGTFNISTITAFVVASSGAYVAKHGNRSITSKCGSADILEAIGANLSLEPDKIAKLIEKTHIGFLFAPNLHSSMKYAVPVRREIGIRTIFNILGPLTNPADAKMQLIGVFSEDLVEKVAKVLINLGIKKAMVVHGYDGLDEITITAKTKIAEINDGWLKTYDLDPQDYNIPLADIQEIKGGDLEKNKQIFLDIIEGKLTGAKRNIVVLNSAAALKIYGKVNSIKEGIELANELIDSHKVLETVNNFVKESQNL